MSWGVQPENNNNLPGDQRWTPRTRSSSKSWWCSRRTGRQLRRRRCCRPSRTRPGSGLRTSTRRPPTRADWSAGSDPPGCGTVRIRAWSGRSEARTKQDARQKLPSFLVCPNHEGKLNWKENFLVVLSYGRVFVKSIAQCQMGSILSSILSTD